jgi:hypothetical protein
MVDPLVLPDVACIIVVPAVRSVASPLLLIVATVAVPELQVAPFRVWVLPSL